MNKGKWILAGVLVCLIPLARYLMSKWEWQAIHGEASFWLMLAGIALVAWTAVIPKQYKKYAFLFAIVFLFLTLSTIRKEAREDAKKEKEKQGQSTTPPTQTVWQENVELTGKEFEGKIVFVPQPTWYEVNYLGGEIYDTPEDKIKNAAYDIWGAGYNLKLKDYFPHSHVPGVSAKEILLIVDGEVGSNDKVCQFPDGKTSVKIWIDKYVRFFRHETFRPDINGNVHWAFQNNYGFWQFQIKKAD